VIIYHLLDAFIHFLAYNLEKGSVGSYIREIQISIKRIMTQTLIQEQINTIKKATKKASESKQSALRFLKDAGIVMPKPASKSSSKKK
jgi:hypothetical protein